MTPGASATLRKKFEIGRTCSTNLRRCRIPTGTERSLRSATDLIEPSLITRKVFEGAHGEAESEASEIPLPTRGSAELGGGERGKELSDIIDRDVL